MKFYPPPLTGEPCDCLECVVAGVAGKPVVRTPGGELHGRKLADWYAARDRFNALVEEVNAKRRMP
jgi:hypothetical protein